MAFTPIQVANEFLAKHKDDGIDPLKLQKLLYFANGWWLAIKGEALLSEQPQVRRRNKPRERPPATRMLYVRI